MGHKLCVAGLSFETTHAEARQVISELSGKTLGERSITVDEARPPRQSGSRPRGRPHGSSYGRGR